MRKRILALFLALSMLMSITVGVQAAENDVQSFAADELVFILGGEANPFLPDWSNGTGTWGGDLREYNADLFLTQPCGLRIPGWMGFFIWFNEHTLVPEPGYMYRAVTTAYAPQAVHFHLFGLQYEIGAATENRTQMGSMVVTSDGWNEYVTEFYVPVEATNANFYLYNGEAGAVYFDEVRFYKLVPSGYSLKSAPTFITFYEGEPIDLSGLRLTVNYATTAKTSEIALSADMDDVTITGYDAFAPGNQEVTVSYKNFDFTYNVEVLAGGPEIGRMEASRLPAKTHYWQGEDFDFTGLKLYVEYTNGSSTIIEATADMVDASAFDGTSGEKIITVSFGGAQMEFSAWMLEPGMNFEIVGSRVIDPFGNDFVAIGSNGNGPRWYDGTREMIPDLELYADVWKFNTMRLCSPFGWEWQNWANTDLDAIIKTYTDRGVAIMIEAHDFTGGWPVSGVTGYNNRGDGITDAWTPSLEEITQLWVDIAEQYIDNPYVWINILNEPGNHFGSAMGGGFTRRGTEENPLTSDDLRHPTFSHNAQQSADYWYEVHRHITEAIRAAGFNNIIVLDEHVFGQANFDSGNPGGPGSAVLNKGEALNAEFDNLLYSIHPYGWRGQTTLNLYVEACIERDLALVFGEWGDFGGSDHIRVLLNTALKYDIGHIYWAWSADHSICNPATGPRFAWGINEWNGITKPTNLTWSGSLLWDATRGTLTAPVPHHLGGVHDPENLIFNGNFSAGLAGWDLPFTKTLTRETVYGQEMDVLTLSGASNPWAWGFSQPAGLVGGVTYEFSLYAKGSVGNVFLADGRYGSGTVVTDRYSLNSDGWQHYSFTFTAPRTMDVELNISHWGVELDRPLSFANITLKITDGGGPVLCPDCNANPCECIVLCPDCNANPCECTPVTVCPDCNQENCVCPSPSITNLIENGDFSNGMAGWNIGEDYSQSLSKEDIFGQEMNVLTIGTDDPGFWAWGWAFYNIGFEWWGQPSLITVQAGKTYEFSFYARGQARVALSNRGHDTNGFINFAANSSDWQHYSGEFTVDSNMNLILAMSAFGNLFNQPLSVAGFSLMEVIPVCEVCGQDPCLCCEDCGEYPCECPEEQINLIVNGDFSNWIHGWVALWGVSHVPNGFADGVNAVVVGSNWQAIVQEMELQAGKTYKLTYWAKIVDDGQTGDGAVCLGEPTGSQGRETMNELVNTRINGTEWQLYVHEFTAPATMTYRVSFWATGANVNYADIELFETKPIVIPPCDTCGEVDCVCAQPCDTCGELPCICPCGTCGEEPCVCACEYCEENPCVCFEGLTLIFNYNTREQYDHLINSPWWYGPGFWGNATQST
ncbi:MAG: carbohydrate binding domain-containing protein, partial [Defluviitaleaceae bacterium]|nr:carbohydrate binding domain-containing protein [Defluviitaleaceae bacterium]